MLRVWNISLLVATFALTILGTFLTRSGVIASVHAFSDGDIGPWLLGVLRRRRRRARSALIAWRGDRLRSPGAIDSPISREGAFLANNVLFAVFAFVVLLGTVFPLIVEALQDRKITVGAPFFDRLSIPIGLTLLFLMAVAPVLPWRKASVELLRDRLFWPAWCGVGALAVAVIARRRRAVRRCSPSALGGFAAGAAAAPAGPGHPPPGLARTVRPGQRRDDRPPRRDHHRRRARRVEQLQPGQRAAAHGRAAGQVRRAHVRAASTSPRSPTPARPACAPRCASTATSRTRRGSPRYLNFGADRADAERAAAARPRTST